MEIFNPHIFINLVCQYVGQKYFEGIGIPENLKEKFLPERNKLSWSDEFNPGEWDLPAELNESFLHIDYFAVPYLKIGEDVLNQLIFPKKQPENYHDCLQWKKRTQPSYLEVSTFCGSAGVTINIVAWFCTQKFSGTITLAHMDSVYFKNNKISKTWLKKLSKLVWKSC